MAGAVRAGGGGGIVIHTKGPWEVNLKGSDAKVVCPDGRYFLIGDIIYHEENKANAHLIAACPTMYDYIAKKAAEGDEDAAKIIAAI